MTVKPKSTLNNAEAAWIIWPFPTFCTFRYEKKMPSHKNLESSSISWSFEPEPIIETNLRRRWNRVHFRSSFVQLFFFRHYPNLLKTDICCVALEVSHPLYWLIATTNKVCRERLLNVCIVLFNCCCFFFFCVCCYCLLFSISSLDKILNATNQKNVNDFDFFYC